MTIDPQVLRAERHVEIGRVLQRQAQSLPDHWSRRAAEEQPHAARVHEQVLRDHLLKFLETLGQAWPIPPAPTPGPMRRRPRNTANSAGRPAGR